MMRTVYLRHFERIRMLQAKTSPARGRLFREVLGPGLLLASYCAVLMAVLPEGINRRYVMILALVACAIVVGAVVIGVLVERGHRSQPSVGRVVSDDHDRSHRSDAWLLLLPMAPVVQYLLVNREMFSLVGIILAMAALAGLASLLTLVVPYLLRRAISQTVATLVGVSLSFVLYNMAAFARSNVWYGLEDATLPLAVLAALIVCGVLLYRYRREGTYTIAAVYFVSTVVLVPFTSDPAPVIAGKAHDPSGSVAQAEALATIAAGVDDDLPDIVFLTYDAYVENETMRAYGIDNSDQEAYLEALGFEIERGTYTVAHDTMGSMGRVLGGTSPGDGLAGNSPLFDALRAAGYETNGIFRTDYYFSKSDPGYDRYFPTAWPQVLTMLRGVLEGRFRHDLGFIVVPREEFDEVKRATLISETAQPQLIYTHDGPGHSQNSGACLDDETKLFADRLARANEVMREDVESVLQYRPGAVVIVNGDHGPSLTKNCWGLQHGDFDADDVTRLDIQDRFGSFLAIRWPDDLRPAETNIEVLQDVLPAVIDAVFPGLDADALRGSTRLAAGEDRVIAGVNLEHGVMSGGRHDGLPLFETPSD